jgi:hypothetical protein
MVFLATNTRGIARAEPDAACSWQVTNGLPEFKVTCLAADPANPEVIYAGTHGHGVLRSADKGRSWQPVGMSGQIVKSLAVSPGDAATLYAGTKPASVFVSRDGGEAWAELEGFHRARRWYWFSPAEPPDWRAYVSGLSISPTDPKVIVAGIEAGAVVRSEDGGRTWSGHRKKADRDCHELAFHLSSGDWVYEAGGGGPAVSRDGGKTWRHPLRGLLGRYCMACAADPERPEVWYVSASPMAVFPKVWQMPIAHSDGNAHAAIYRSSGGAPWEKLEGGLPQPLDYMAYALLTDPRVPGHLYAGLSNGDIWHSPDYGDSWKRLPFNLGGIYRSLIMA